MLVFNKCKSSGEIVVTFELCNSFRDNIYVYETSEILYVHDILHVPIGL